MRLHGGTKRIIILSDLQVPFEHRDALDFAALVQAELETDETVCIGDEVDHYYLSRFENDPEADGGAVELRKAKARLQEWYKIFPEVKVCTSNHTQRVYNKAISAGISDQYLKPINEWLGAPDTWVWADKFVIDGIRFEHGDAQGGMYAARNIAICNRQSTVIGHHHSHGGISYVSNDSEMIFGMNVGCLVDMKTVAFKYAKKFKFKPTLGLGVITEGVPQFIPMLLTKSGRWIRELIY
jgi:hypothetical protein